MSHVKADTGAIPEAQKLTIYQFGKTSNIGDLAGNSRVAGFFVHNVGRSVAFVPLRDNPDRSLRRDYNAKKLPPEVVLFHEYTHYFMYQHAAGAYPLWYQEGFAELFGTLEIEDKGFRIGAPPEIRQYELHAVPIHVDQLLAPDEENPRFRVVDVYAGGWLLTSYLTFEPSRQGQLATYLRQINNGAKPRDAAEIAFGDLDRFKSDLDAYRRGRAHIIEVQFENQAAPQVTVSAVPEDEADAMMVRLRQERGVTPDQARILVGEARELAVRYPQSSALQAIAAEAELDADNLAEAEAFALKAAELNAGNARAQLLLAKIALERAKEDSSQFIKARKFYLAANAIDSKNPEALYGYYLSYALAGETAPENAIIALEDAFFYAQFDNNIRMSLTRQLLIENRKDDAQAVFSPLINGHAGKKQRARFKEVWSSINSGDFAKAIDLLAPRIDTPDEDDED